jgi:drug/metabolite transporter (DMT)-like permease
MALLTWIALGQRLPAVKVVGLTLGFVGATAVIGGDLFAGTTSSTHAPPYAYGVVLAGALSWAAGSLLFVRHARGIALEWAVGLQSVLASVALLVPWLLIEGAELPDGSPEFWTTFGYVALLAAFVGQLAYFSLLRRRESTVVGSFVFLVPVVAATSGVLLLDEPMSVLKALGGACVLAGIALVNRGSRSG